jgi:hypothetical protein
MSCEYGHTDCVNEDNKCYLCVNELHYQQQKQKSYGLKKNIKADTKRMGSISEVKNHQQNQKMLTAATTGTPNSGAGSVKGDEQIRGIINIMEEIKTTTKKNEGRQPGKESFTIQRSWMDKLEAEAAEARMEFNYLKFSFDQHDDKFYVVCNSKVFMDMVATMVHDRRQISSAQDVSDISEKRRQVVEAENVLLRSQLALEQAKIEALSKELYRTTHPEDQL